MVTVDSEIFANSIKDILVMLRQDLPISINESMILPFREGFIFTKLRICELFRENKVLAKISKFTVVSLKLY